MTVPLTGAGAAVGGAGLGLLILGLVARAPSLTAVGASAVSALLIGCVLVGVRPRLRVSRAVAATAVDVGAQVQIRVQVTNSSRWLPAAGRLIDAVAGRAGQDVVPVSVPVVPPRATRSVDYTMPARRRGVIALGPLRLENTDPLGLLRRHTEVGERVEVVVHPRVHHGALDLAGAARSVEGVDRDGVPNGAIAFHSLRDYVPGDDPRTIHWRSTARRGELVVRQQVDVVLPRLTVLIDTRSYAYGYPRHEDGDEQSAFEAAVGVAASLASAAVEHQVSLQLATTAGATLAVAGPTGLAAAMDLLARLDGDAGLGFVEMSAGLDVRPGAGLLILSGQGSGLLDGQAPAADATAISILARRHTRCLAVVLGDAPEVGDVAAAGAALGSCRLVACPDVPTALRTVTAWGAWHE